MIVRKSVAKEILVMNCRQIYNVAVYFTVLVALVNVASGQSKDKGNPTPLTSSEISGLLNSESRGNWYYYSFVANPGEVSITLSIQPDPPSSILSATLQQVSFTLYDRNGEAILDKFVTATEQTGGQQVVGRVSLTRRQTVVLGIRNTLVSSGTGKYRLRVSGAVDINEGKNAPEYDPVEAAVQRSILARRNQSQRDKIDNFECLPKQGTLIVKMKDGSKKIIDLSEAETVTVVP